MVLSALYKFKKSVLLFLAVASGVVYAPYVQAQDMTIEESYQMRGKERIKFDIIQSSIPPEEADYLDHLFLVTDLAFKERMEMLRYFHYNKSQKYIHDYLDNIDKFIESFNKETAPTEHLKKAEKYIISALRDHQNFFTKWHNTKGSPTAYSKTRNHMNDDEYVLKSHRKIVDAYVLINLAYPDETSYNQKAIYQHLCALDFI